MGAIDELSRALGIVEGTLQSVVKGLGDSQKSTADALTEFREAMSAQHNQVVELRQDMKDKANEITAAINGRITGLATDLNGALKQIEAIKEELKENKPYIEQFKEIKIKTKFSVNVLRGIYLLLTAFGAYLLAKLEKLIFGK